MTGTVPLASAVLAGDRRAASRLISAAEAGNPAIEPDLRALYRAGGRARMIGVTGPPGAGKSTLVDQLIARLRERNQSVAVLLVDPSSPLSGGAVLGDRLRMSRHADDRHVLIRSMATRGALGGLSHATGDALTVLDAMGFDSIIVETVGVGQSEVDILAHVDLVLLLQTGDGGDAIQTVKAGVLEIADIIILNKAEGAGAEPMLRALKEMVAQRAPTAEGWDTPVLAAEAMMGAGVDEVLGAIDSFFVCRRAHPADGLRRQRERLRARVLVLASTILRHRLADLNEQSLQESLGALIERRSDPHEAAIALLFHSAGARARKEGSFDAAG